MSVAAINLKSEPKPNENGASTSASNARMTEDGITRTSEDGTARETE